MVIRPDFVPPAGGEVTNPVDRKDLTVLRGLAAVVGLLFSIFVLNVALVSTQASSGDEPFGQALLFFALSFAVAFGLGAASAAALGRLYRFWPTARAFGTGGAVGGVILAGSEQLIHRYEPLLRSITDGGPIGSFALVGLAVAVAAPVPIGLRLLRRTRRTTSALSRGGDLRT